MNNTTKERYNEVLEYFSPQRKREDCPCGEKECCNNYTVDLSVGFGDCIEKLITPDREGADFVSINELTLAWLPFSFSLSLQEIIEDGWEEKFMPVKRGDKTGDIIKVLKQPQSDLISFLHNLIYEN